MHRPASRILSSLLLCGLVLLAREDMAAADCSLTSTGRTPLPDLGPSTYQGHAGGLYPGGLNQPPAAHETAAIDIGNALRPLNASGNLDNTNGRIVMVSIGMSNTNQEFGTFIPTANADPAKFVRTVLVNGAQGGQDLPLWLNPNAATWSNVDSALAQNGLTPAQVQVAWIKQAYKHPADYGGFPTHAEIMRDDLATLVRNLKIRYPNIKLAYLSSRTRAYTNDPAGLNPEPYAYESGFAVKWLIEAQIDGDPTLNYDASQGPVVAPLLLWGAYLWGDGEVARSDGLVWHCSDVVADFTHPSTTGRQKVADQLLAFLKTHPTSSPWFLRRGAVGQQPVIQSATASPASGTAPLQVQFSSSSTDPDGTVTQRVWTFDDGTHAYGNAPLKRFPAPGTYDARLRVTDNQGNTAATTVTVTVAP
jgi:hypothetical protein